MSLLIIIWHLQRRWESKISWSWLWQTFSTYLIWSWISPHAERSSACLCQLCSMFSCVCLVSIATCILFSLPLCCHWSTKCLLIICTCFKFSLWLVCLFKPLQCFHSVSVVVCWYYLFFLCWLFWSCMPLYILYIPYIHKVYISIDFAMGRGQICHLRTIFLYSERLYTLPALVSFFPSPTDYISSQAQLQ